MKKDFLDALTNYDQLRLAVYSPITIPLSERKKLGEFLFFSLMGNDTPMIPKWFSPLYNEISESRIYKELALVCQGNPLLSAQVTAEIIKGLDKSLDKLLKALRKWIEKEEKPEDSAKSVKASSSQASSGGEGEIISAGKDGDTAKGRIAEKRSELEMQSVAKSRIEEILKGITLLPIQLSMNDLKKLSPEKKQESQKMMTASIEELLEKVLSHANEWRELYDLLTAILPGLGWDYMPGFLKYNLLNKYKELAKLLDKIPALKDLANRLGRYHSMMGEKIWDPTAHGKSEVFSVERSGDIERILPIELVQLGYPPTKYLFYSKLADKSLLTYELKGEGWTQPEENEKGPVIICIDTSSSMSGLPESMAKAVSLAVTKEANSQSRKVILILFGSRNETQEIIFDRSENAIDSLMNFLNLSFGGGTDFDSALKSALKALDDTDYSYADVLFVTDGYGEISRMREEFQRIKSKLGTRFFTLLIESDDTDALQDISDEVWILQLNQESRPSLSKLRSSIF
ncbi:MAG: VWA domain-containing protein [Candidatus Thorarchaeota archaeon]